MSIQSGKYEIHEKLGEGATSEVYRARDTTTGQEVALKLLKPSLVSDPTAFKRFQQEASTAERLSHPNIAAVYGMGELDGRYFIAMRSIPGKSLDKVLKEDGRLTWAAVLCMVTQIGVALDYAHAQGFLHRDVKPSNIICTPDGDYVLTDFGLTRAMMTTGLTSHTGAVLGTPPYIPPEIWLGKPAVPATDQYALACIVYEALTGEVLFSGETPPAIMTRHVLQGVEFPHGLEHLPSGIREVLQKALAIDPSGRYADNLAFATALKTLNPPVVESAPSGVEAAVEPVTVDETVPVLQAAEVQALPLETTNASTASAPPVPIQPPVSAPAPAWPPAQRTSRTAILSLVAGIAGVSIVPWVGSIIAILTGHMAKGRIKKNPSLSGSGLATAGQVLGYVGFFIGCLYISLSAISLFLGNPILDIVNSIINPPQNYPPVEQPSVALVETQPPAETSILFSDEFSDPNSGWESASGEAGGFGYADGYYYVYSNQAETNLFGSLNQEFSDLVIQVEATQIGAPASNNDAYGIICRLQPDGSGYYFRIGGDGYYSVEIGSGGSFTRLLSGGDYWQTSSAINQGNATNYIVVTCNASQLKFEVNGAVLFEDYDYTFTSGRIALLAHTYEENSTVEFHYDNLVVSTP